MTGLISGCRAESQEPTRPGLLTKASGMPGDVVVPEETVFGIVSRHHVTSGNQTAGDTLRELLIRRTVSLGTAFPSGLNLVIQRLPLPFDNVQKLIEDHTIYPYFRVFANPSHYSQVAASMAAGTAHNMKIILGLLASRLGAADVLRFCPRCAKNDLDVIGIATWYRVHQLPGVLICPYHGVQLTNSNCLVQRLKRQQLFLPEQSMKWNQAYSVPTIDQRAYSRLILFARLSAQLLLYPRAPLEAPTWRNQCLSHLARMGLATASLRIRQSETAREFLNFWSDIKDVVPFSGVLQRCDKEDSWLANLSRRSRSAHHPLFHILLIGFMTESIESFFDCPPPATAIGLARPLKQHSVKALEIADLGVQARSMRQLAKEMNLSLNSVLVKAEKMGVLIKRRPKKLDIEVCSRIRLSLATGDAIPDIVHATKLSASTINRILGGDSALQVLRRATLYDRRLRVARNNLSAAIATSSTAGFKKLRNIVRSDFTWLYRHDRTWLNKQLSPAPKSRTLKTSVDWNARDNAMMREVETAVAQIVNASGRPVRASISEIGRRTSHPSWLDKHLTKLPQTHALLGQVVEPTSNFRARRIAWHNKESYP